MPSIASVASVASVAGGGKYALTPLVGAMRDIGAAWKTREWLPAFTAWLHARKRTNPTFVGWGLCLLLGSLTITYFHTGNPHYHRRGVVSRSCSGWEGVVPTRYGHQA